MRGCKLCNAKLDALGYRRLKIKGFKAGPAFDCTRMYAGNGAHGAARAWYPRAPICAPQRY
eukprot:1157788-Pelagomonas_calceolata.AAC.2